MVRSQIARAIATLRQSPLAVSRREASSSPKCFSPSASIERECRRQILNSRTDPPLKEAGQFFGKPVPELGKATRGDWTRAAVGWAIWKETVVTQRWIAEKLNLKSAANASQQIRRFTLEPEQNLSKRIREWKKSRNVA